MTSAASIHLERLAHSDPEVMRMRVEAPTSRAFIGTHLRLPAKQLNR